MKTIWKKELVVTDIQTIDLPEGSVILAAQFQKGILCLWAMVDTDKKLEERRIAVIGTGNRITEELSVNRKYIGTCQQFGGSLIWHVFEVWKVKLDFDNRASVRATERS